MGNDSETMERKKLLAGLLKRVGYFDNTSLNGRVAFQKTIYFIQAFGLNLGYRFSWYLHGPYCTELAKEGYEIEKEFDRYNPVKFVESKNEQKLIKTLLFLGNKITDCRWLETAASIHALKKLNQKITKEEVFCMVSSKSKELGNKNTFDDAWNRLREYNIL